MSEIKKIEKDVEVKHFELKDIIANLCNLDKDRAKECVDFLQFNNMTSNFLNVNDQTAIDTFENILKTTGEVPSLELFSSYIPDYNLSSSLVTKDVMNVARIFVKEKKNQAASLELQNLANRIGREGITQDIADKISNIMKTDSVATKYTNIKDKIVDVYEKSIDNSGIKTGIEQIDEMIGGLKAGQVSVVSGYTGMGKSISSVSIMHSALEQGFNVCYLSLELGADHLMYNTISRHSLENKFAKKIEHRDLKDKKLSEDDWKYVKENILPDLDTLPSKFYILDEQDIEAYNQFAFDSKLQEIEDLCKEETGKGIDLLIVDHVQMLAYSDQGSRLSENTVINRWCNYFRSNCLDFLKSKRQIHVILVAQINRQGYLKAAKNNGMYDLTALKEANELETCAAVILGIFSDPSLVASSQVRIGIMKNRDGSRSSDAYTCPADFAHQLIGGVGSTINTTMAKASKNDVVGVIENMDSFASDLDLGFGDFSMLDSSPIDLV